MFIRLFLLLFLSLTGLQLHADVSYWDSRLVKSYVHYSDLQRRWAMSFLAPHLKSLIGDEEILDWLEGTFAPVVPKDKVREFYTQWIEEYLKLDPSAISAEGVIYAKLGYIGIETVLHGVSDEQE